ncbi:MAG: DUF4842 domain-containing protein, partial [Bacteroidaceae bacterium]|nr:DUF4842 domain-containing protein [Bacteroidaceae bacterium]
RSLVQAQAGPLLLNPFRFMMRKKCWLLCMVALCLSLIATSCSKKESSSQEEMTDSFIALVMGGKSIDPNQTWTTASTRPVKVSVDLEANKQYKIFFYLSNPALDTDACYAGMAVLSSGESKTVFVNAPTGITQLYVACYDENGTAICNPISGNEVSFTGTISSSPGTPSPTTGNNWSVPSMSMPSTSKYTTGSMVSPENIDPESPTEAELHVLINNEYTGIIPALNSHSNLSVYVTGTWTLTFDQRFSNGNVLVVGKGGKVIVPTGFKLSNGGIDGTSSTSGQIIVMPGGEISGNGIVEATSDANNFYNGGSVSAANINLVGGALYNAGTAGSESSTLTGEANSTGNPGQFINYTNATFSNTSGSALSILNAGNIKVVGNLTLNNASRMDDGSSIECASLSLQGDGSSNSVLQMGNGAYLNCNGFIVIRNYGIWGPSGKNYKSNAIFKANACSRCETTSGNANTFMLDHVQLQMPSNFMGFDYIVSWINGSGEGLDASRQTCYFSFLGNSSPSYNGMFYAFEIPNEYDVKEFDYNDLVLQVSAPYDNGDGTFTSFLSVAAVGSVRPLWLLYNGEQIGQEAHDLLYINKDETFNVSSKAILAPRYIGEIKFTSDVDISKLPFSLRYANSDGSNVETVLQPTTPNQAPLYIAVSANSQGKWRWCKEGSNIGLAFLKFSAWAANQQTNTDWYYSNNASSNHIIPEW